MTFEKRCLIELSDILSLQYECANCHAARIIPVDKLDPHQVEVIALNPCPYCNERSGFEIGTNEFKALKDLSSSLFRAIPATEGRNLKLRLSIKCAD